MKGFQDFLLVEASYQWKEVGGDTFACKDGKWHQVTPVDEHGELPPSWVALDDATAKELGL